jgi:hypothetical protein
MCNQLTAVAAYQQLVSVVAFEYGYEQTALNACIAKCSKEGIEQCSSCAANSMAV